MIISRTPLRISFVGGGSDLREYYKLSPGSVISTAINKYVFVFVNKRLDNFFHINYSKTEWVKDVNKIEHNIIREAIKLVGIDGGVDIAYVGDVQLASVGTGLGASSSLAVGVLNALYKYTGKKVSSEKLAHEACKIEIDILNHPIGKQDQYIVSYGGFNYIQFNSDETVNIRPVTLSAQKKKDLSKKLLLLYTGLVKSSSAILKKQGNNMDRKKERSFMSTMANFTKEMEKRLKIGELDVVGELLHKNWLLKKKMAEGISNIQIDTWYKKACELGVIGGKICGAGGGGFLLLYASEENHDKIISALSDLVPLDFSFESCGSKIIHSQS